MARKTVLRNLLSKWGILSIEMQKATISDETVQTIQDDGSIISETTVEDEAPEIKQAEPVEEKISEATEEEQGKKTGKAGKDVKEEQTGLFDDKRPPLKDEDYPF
ncbi:hypothetical protein IGI46_004953 [Enterococcus sp. AZ163]